MIKLAVSGSRGRMGGSIIRLAEAEPDLEVVAAFDIGEEPRPTVEKCDVLIDFTSPDAAIKNLRAAMDAGKGVVIGTTGLSEADVSVINEAASSVPIVFSPNMAVGVNVFFRLVKDAAALLGGFFGISVSETHHVHKKDAPSGTAKKIRRIAAEAGRLGIDSVKVDSRREGEVVGDHAIVFDAAEETLTLSHHAKSRNVFARGALVAARFVSRKEKGLYGMDDVLGINDV